MQKRKVHPFIGPIAAEVPTAFGRARPIRSYYFESAVHNKIKDTAKIGHASTPIGAIRSAVVRILQGELMAARIFDERSAQIFVIFKDGNHLRVVGQIDKLRIKE